MGDLLDRILKWLSNKKNAAILASIVGIITSEVLVAAKILVFVLGPVFWDLYMLDIVLFFISSLFFFLAFRGLKKERESIVLIFIFAQGIILSFMVTDALLLLYTLIVNPYCEIYWPLFYACTYNDLSDGFIFRCTSYGIIVYFVMSCALYWTIWRGYKFLKIANIKREMPQVPIPAACNTSNATENLSTAHEHASTSSHNRSDQQQNQPPGDWPTFFDHQKCVEHERNILRVT